MSAEEATAALAVSSPLVVGRLKNGMVAVDDVDRVGGLALGG